MNKKAIELSITTLVVIIISIIILIYSIYLVYNILTSASSLEKDIEKRSNEKLEEIMTNPREIINVPFDEREGKTGRTNTFLIGVRNTFDSAEDFSALVSFDKATVDDKRLIQDTNTDFIEENWLGNYQVLNHQSIDSLEYKPLKLLIKVDDRVSQSKNTQDGNYVFNVCVFTDSQPPADRCSFETKDLFYNKQLKTIVISVS